MDFRSSKQEERGGRTLQAQASWFLADWTTKHTKHNPGTSSSPPLVNYLHQGPTSQRFTTSQQSTTLWRPAVSWDISESHWNPHSWSHGLLCHLYADDTNVCHPVSTLHSTIISYCLLSSYIFNRKAQNWTLDLPLQTCSTNGLPQLRGSSILLRFRSKTLQSSLTALFLSTSTVNKTDMNVHPCEIYIALWGKGRK